MSYDELVAAIADLDAAYKKTGDKPLYVKMSVKLFNVLIGDVKSTTILDMNSLHETSNKYGSNIMFIGWVFGMELLVYTEHTVVTEFLTVDSEGPA